MKTKYAVRALFFLLGWGLCMPQSLYSISFSNMTIEDDSEYENALEQALGQIFWEMKTDLTIAYKSYSGDIATKGINMGRSITDDQATEFNDYADSKYEVFQKACIAAGNKALLSYYNFKEEQGRSTIGIDSTAQNIQSAISDIQDDFKYQVQKLTQQIVSGGTLNDMLKSLAQEMETYDAQKEAEFLRVQQKATVHITRSGWDDFVLALEQYWPILGEQLLTDLGETMGEIIEERIGTLGDLAVGMLGQIVSELSDTVKEGAAELLEKMGKSLSPKIEEALEKFLPKLEPLLKLLGKELENHSLAVMVSLLQEFLRSEFTTKNDFTSAKVSTSEDLSSGEKAFLEARSEKALEALKNFNIHIPLNIGMLTSGNGVRSGLFHMGSVLSLQKAKLWDAILYNAGTSASSWTIFASSYAYLLDGITMEEYQSELISDGRLATDLPRLSVDEYVDIGLWFATQFAYELSVSSADLFGSYVASRSFLDDHIVADLADMTEKIAEADIPYPLAAGVYSRGTVSSSGAVTAPTEQVQRSIKNTEENITDDELAALADEIDSDTPLTDDTLDTLLDEVLNEEDSGSDSTGNTQAIVPYEGATNDSSDDESSINSVTGQIVSNASSTLYGWVEFGPCEVRDVVSNAAIVPYAFGAKYNGGNPVAGVGGKIPSYPLANLFGMFGARYASVESDNLSSLSASITKPSFDFLGYKVKLPIEDWISKFLNKSGVKIDDINGLTPVYHNFMKGVIGSPVTALDDLKLVDSSLDIDIPFPLLVGRAGREMDVILIWHADGGDTVPFERAVAYFKRNNIDYPVEFNDVTKETLTENDMIVFNDPREDNYKDSIPVFIYLPFTEWPSYTDVVKFAYSKAQVKEVASLVDQQFTSVLSDLTKVLQALALRKGDTELRDQLENSAPSVTPATETDGVTLSDDDIDKLLDDTLGENSDNVSDNDDSSSEYESVASDTVEDQIDDLLDFLEDVYEDVTGKEYGS